MKDQNKSFFSRYKEIFIAIVLFIVLDLGVLILSFFTALQISKDAVGINLAGRQRMLSQRITKSLLLIEIAQRNNEPTTGAFKELNLSYDLFDTTLKAFDIGGFATGATGNQVTLQSVKSDTATLAVKDGKKLWEPLKDLLKPVLLSNGDPSNEILKAAIDYATANNLMLLKEMNNLTVALEKEASDRAGFLRMIQSIAIFFLIANYIYIIYDFLTKIRRSDAEIEETTNNLRLAVNTLQSTTSELENSQRETDTILKTVRQGLFLIDKDFKITSKYSEELKEMFRIDDLSGMSFISIIQRLFTEKDYHTCKDYCEMLFNLQKKEKTLAKINPFLEAEVHFQEKDAQFVTKYYEFQFSRILIDQKIENVFVSVRDITAQVELTRRLQESEEKKEHQFNMLLMILNLNFQEVQDFCHKSLKSIQIANESLKPEDLVSSDKQSTNSTSLREKLDALFRQVHSVKSHAASLKMEHFVDVSHEFENAINRLKKKANLSGEDFISIIGQMAEIKKSLEECLELSDRMKSFHNIQNKDIPKTNGNAHSTISLQEETLKQMIKTLQEETGKKATLSFETSKNIHLTEESNQLLYDVASQLIRNSFAHGIENGKDRITSGKPETATITLQLLESDQGSIMFHYMDDGSGLDTDKIKKQSIDRGIYTEDAAQEKTEHDWWLAIFEPGFSTKSNADTLSGRGYGLDIVRQSIMEELQGTITLYSEAGQYCRFDIEIPNGKSAL